ncbi:beta-glucosidase 13-like [Malania oleifera]|uniref:beta-glucosidase 13-like n=1 Tax=Malania oleifera TaxID=397392 RepID=UPI0025ADEADC|nr:beta-glucosidase 13-like [Malania oleifera]
MALLINLPLPKCSSFPSSAGLTVATSTTSFISNKGRNYQNALPPKRRGSPTFVIRCSSDVSRSDFPSNFIFGASTSAIQADVRCLKDMKADSYRFSISWSRILPNGKLTDESSINQEGIDFYNNLIDSLIADGIEPFVTLFHFDLPASLQSQYNGLLSSDFVDDFRNYAGLCFKIFGKKVKHWITFNEPEVFCQYGYKTDMVGKNHPALYPYVAAHHLLLAHAKAAQLYRDLHQGTQNGEIGMSLSAEWFLPHSSSPTDKDAANRAWDFMVGWFLDPLVTGDYPFSMKAIVRDRLPTFTEEEAALVKDSFDFIGINYYTSRYTKGLPISPNDVASSYWKDKYVRNLVVKDGKLIGPEAQGEKAIFIYPKGLAAILIHLKLVYNNPKVYITENGYPQKRDDSLPVEEALQDDIRISCIQDHLSAVKAALKEGANVNGYFIWSLMDCMEMGSGYTVRYGLNYTDYDRHWDRYAKKSALWLRDFLSSSSASASTTTTTTTPAAAAPANGATTNNVPAAVS